MSQQPSPPALPPAPRRRDAIETHLMPDGSALLYDPTTNKAHALDPIGSFIWEFCDGTLTPEQIAAALADALPQASDIRAEALRVVAEFAAAGLLAPASGAALGAPGQRENS